MFFRPVGVRLPEFPKGCAEATSPNGALRREEDVGR
jgi:hypothetical protein